MSLDLWLKAPTGGGESLCSDSINATHNLAPMWREAGVFDALYESVDKRAGDFVATLRIGIADMEDHPEVYRALNPPNGWGDYGGALSFLRTWLDMSVKHPDALISVSR